MPLRDEMLRELGISLKRRAKAQDIRVNDSFVIELKNYAGRQGVKHLDEKDMSMVLEKIGEEALSKERVLDGPAVLRTIYRVCRPKNAFDLCSGAARNILQELGRTDAVTKLDSLNTELLSDWALDDQ
ncbi:MAG TPA: hypothetical protein VES88_12260 [Gemmatimonadaceae bacterium]|nr:hypothetical protein [Gemmatimonadaceae bacterium]